MSRIRTIKPEFGQHDKLSALPAETHLIAGLLLTYADDFGYFNANPKLIQAAICPLRELSREIPEHLGMLREIGYLELRQGSDGREYGKITNFLEHQRVSHPTESKIAPLWNSREKFAKPPETFVPEGKGKEVEVEVEGEAPPDLHPTQYAARLLQEIGYPVAKQNIIAVASAIEAEVKLGRSKPAAYEYVLACTRDLIDQGGPITTYTFTEAKYRPESRRNGNGQSKPSASAERAERSKRNILDAFAANARGADPPDEPKRKIGAAG